MTSEQSRKFDAVIYAMREAGINDAPSACQYLASLTAEVAGEYSILSKHVQGAIDELYRAKVSEETAV